MNEENYKMILGDCEQIVSSSFGDDRSITKDDVSNAIVLLRSLSPNFDSEKLGFDVYLNSLDGKKTRKPLFRTPPPERAKRQCLDSSVHVEETPADDSRNSQIFRFQIGHQKGQKNSFAVPETPFVVPETPCDDPHPQKQSSFEEPEMSDDSQTESENSIFNGRKLQFVNDSVDNSQMASDEASEMQSRDNLSALALHLSFHATPTSSSSSSSSSSTENNHSDHKMDLSGLSENVNSPNKSSAAASAARHSPSIFDDVQNASQESVLDQIVSSPIGNLRPFQNSSVQPTEASTEENLNCQTPTSNKNTSKLTKEVFKSSDGEESLSLLGPLHVQQRILKPSANPPDSNCCEEKRRSMISLTNGESCPTVSFVIATGQNKPTNTSDVTVDSKMECCETQESSNSSSQSSNNGGSSNSNMYSQPFGGHIEGRRNQQSPMNALSLSLSPVLLLTKSPNPNK